MYLYIDLKDKQRLTIEVTFINSYIDEGIEYVFMDENYLSPEQSNGYRLRHDNIVSIQYEPHYDDIDPDDPFNGNQRKDEDQLIKDFTTIFGNKFKPIDW